MDEIEQRLRTATDTCISCYGAWRKDQKDGGVREKLLEAMHELRKVTARLEIEIAISERDEIAARPIPIPPHRSFRKQHGGGHDEGDYDDNIGNAVGNGNHSHAPQGPQRSHGGGPRRGGRPGGRPGGSSQGGGQQSGGNQE